MATTRLKIYNGALLICGERSIASVTVTEESRRLLDEVWNDNGVRYCLEQGQWMFAMRTSQFTYNTSVTPSFGLNRAFTKPTDWVLTSAVCSDEYFKAPLLNYFDEAGYWYASIDDVYVRYVSDDSNYGTDYSKWPDTFTDYVKTYFASRICHKMPGGKDLVQKLHGPPGFPQRGLLHQTLLMAKNRCAMASPTSFPARGSWVTSRMGNSKGPMGDRGNSGSLTG